MKGVVGWKAQSVSFHLSIWSMGLPCGYVPHKTGFLLGPRFSEIFGRKNLEKSEFDFLKPISSSCLIHFNWLDGLLLCRPL